MGICSSANKPDEESEKQKTDQARTKALDEKMEGGRDEDAKINKLLLLGAGESGKSTLFKQMLVIYSNEQTLTPNARQDQKDAVFNTIFQVVKDLAEASRRGHGEPETEEGKAAMAWITENKDEKFDQADGKKIRAFWEDPGIQKCYAQRDTFRSNYFLPETTAYFLNQITEITTPGWEPTKDDYLRVRVRTTGIVEHNFSIGANPFQMFDVGGQRNERKKWIHCFENVTAVLFVAAINEFDQVLYEDESANRMDEALTLFDEMANATWFAKTAMILFLNKKDLFEDKIKTINITDSECQTLKEYSGDCRSFDDTVDFIKNCFENKNRTGNTTYVHITCATDTDNVEAVFTDVKDVVIQKALDSCGWS